ncbi:RDD family protein [Macrococcus sp. DPC7161]|uniref:RDD family protein n=1 Tax=Macrococcus sp. DPC7161 TaxID=2507060 RepID=UPI00100AE2DC|nr:RDD family protein [Macrococcus sp. DPC7161]RXK18244.1 RDD family protein [Macrococcus sp. DPC7161]
MNSYYGDQSFESSKQTVVTEDSRFRYTEDLKYVLKAGFGIRMCAYIMDLIIVFSIAKILIGPIIHFGHLEDVYLGIKMFSIENILNAIVYFSYFIFMTFFFKQTLGKMIFQLKVHSKLKQLTFMQVLTRELFGRYICNFIALLYLVVLFNPNKEGIHDMLSDTCVIKENKAYLLKTVRSL